MRILEINKFNYLKGGAEKHFLDLLELFKVKGNKIAVFSMKNSRNLSSEWDEYFISYVGYNSEDSFFQKIKGFFRMFYSFEAKRKIRKLLNDFKPDVVHIHNIYHQISPSILSEIKKHNIPIVMTVHDYKLVCPDYLLCGDKKDWDECRKSFLGWKFVGKKYFKNSHWKSFLVLMEYSFHKFLKIYEKNIDLYITPSKFTKNILVENGLSSERIIVLPHFLTDSNGEISKGDLKKGKRKKYAFCYSRLSKNKGVDKMIDFFKTIPEIDLYLAGDIEDDLKIPKCSNIKYLGFLDGMELKKRIRNSEFVISFSKLPETFGLMALESIMNNKLFLCFDSGAYKEIIKKGKTGWICKDLQEMRSVVFKTVNKEIIFDSNSKVLASKKFNSLIYYKKILGILNVFDKK